MKTSSSVTRRKFLSKLFSIAAAGILFQQNNVIASNQPKDHMEGFDKEEVFHSILRDEKLKGIHEQYDLRLNAAQVSRILEIVNPEYFKDLFERRRCVRKLKYIIDTRQDPRQGYIDFRFGEIYESVDFNGGTYTIKSGDRFEVIGCAHFERVD